jgi:hypothetical protein
VSMDGSIQTIFIVWTAMILLSLGVICVETKLPSKIYATYAFDVKDNVNNVIWLPIRIWKKELWKLMAIRYFR